MATTSVKSAGTAPGNRRQSLLFDAGIDAETISEATIVSAALALGASAVNGWSAAEESLARDAAPAPKRAAETLREQIRSGGDPLGAMFCRLRSAAERRENGATFTPTPIVEAMLDWAAAYRSVARVVDPGAGSARYLLAAGRKLPGARLVGIEIDPLPALVARANLSAAGFADRSTVVVDDYRSVALPPAHGHTLFVGNPPYVRHHRIGPAWKQWLAAEAGRRGLAASQLAGLHAHFFLATAIHAAPQDFGAFITAAEWLDVNYGQLVRELFLSELGGRRIVVIEPEAMPFPDATTTAAVTYFDVGSRPASIGLKRIANSAELHDANGNRMIRRERLQAENRWSHLTHSVRKACAGYIELGELCRVHRGQVTGANKVWIEGRQCQGLPECVLFPAVTKAKELFRAGRVLSNAKALRRVVDLPHELEVFQGPERRAIDRFLRHARTLGAHLAYVAVNRKAWWSVGLREPAPILATYMARRPPAFVRNQAAARHINIAHGLYPREPLAETILHGLVEYLSSATRVTDGRTYAGGLTKFEPREMERLLVPDVSLLAAGQR